MCQTYVLRAHPYLRLWRNNLLAGSELFLRGLTSSLAAERSLSRSRSAAGSLRSLPRSPIEASFAEVSS
jgi:hypothetical protein